MPTLQFKGRVFVENHHLAVPYHEWRPIRSKGLSDKASLHDNLIIEGDNLAALKALLPTHHGKVKCIYIDPPYNTGNEGWAYNDNVNSPLMQDWLGKVVDRDDLTRHDKWCCMMLPRLKLLRELLRDDGAIFVSVDDNEVHRLRCLMDEVFGEENLIGEMVWRSRNFSDARPTSGLSTDHEYVLAYGRSADARFRGKRRYEGKYRNRDNDPRGSWTSCSLRGKASQRDRPNLHFNLVNPDTGDVYEPDPETGWICRPETMDRKITEGRILWPRQPKGTPREKVFLAELKTAFLGFPSVIDGVFTSDGTAEIREIFGERAFTFPKSWILVRDLVEQVATEPEDIILDSFAGSGTTAHAVLALNKEDGGNRRFILVECEDYVDSITAERVRRVVKGVPKAKDAALKAELGGTFSYFKLGEPMRQESLLDGSHLPEYEALASYVFFTATGEEFEPERMERDRWFIGRSRLYDVYLIYENDLEKLKNMALTLDVARKFPRSQRNKLVFAPTKYLDSEFLHQFRVTFQQLPFQIYETFDKLTAKGRDN